MRAPVVVLRSPDLAVLAFHREGLVLYPGGQGVLARPLESGQVDRRLDQRTDRPHRVQGPVEAGEARVATADQGLDLTGFRIGHDHRRLDLVDPLAPTETLERFVDGGLGLLLQDRIEAGEDAQPFLGQVLVAVVLAQLALDQVEEGRIGAVGHAALPGHAERALLGGVDFLLGRHALLGEHVEHQVAPRQRTIRVTPRVEVGRSLDHADQQRHLVELELGQRLAEEILAGQAEAMDRSLPILAEEHLVEIGLEDVALVVVQLQQHRHHRFVDLAAQAAFVAQEEVLHQLLGQGAAALAQLAGRGVDPHRPRHGLQRHTMVVPEVAILDRDQGVDQVGRHLVELDQDAILMVRRIQAADQQRLKARHRQFLAVGLAQPADVVAVEAHANALGRFRAFVELEATGIEFDRAGRHRYGSRAAHAGLATVAEGVEFAQEVFPAQLQAVEQLKRAGIDLRRDGPAPAGEFLLHHGIEIDGEAGEEHQADEAELEGPAEPFVQAGCRACFAVTGTGGSGTRHGGALYVLYPQRTDTASAASTVCAAPGDRRGGSAAHSTGDPANGCYPPARFALSPLPAIMRVFAYFRGKDIP